MTTRALVMVAAATLVVGCSSDSSGPSGPAAGPTVSIGDASAVEPTGVNIPQPATFLVTLSQAVAKPVTFTWTTRGVTAISGKDYGLPTEDTASIAAMSTTTTLQVMIIADTIPDDNETFEVVLSHLTNAKFADSVAIGTITEAHATGANAVSAAEADKPARLTM